MLTGLSRLIAAASGFWQRSLRRQLIFVFSTMTIGLLVLFSGFLLLQQRDFLDRSAIKQATALAHALANSSSSWVLANDVVGLQEVLQGFDATPDLKRAYVLSLRGEVLASTRDREIGRYVVDPRSLKLLAAPAETQIIIADAHQIDVAEPIVTGQRQVGWARIGLTRTAARANLQSLFLTGLLSSAIGAVFSLLAAVVLARRLTRNLNRLVRATHQVASGQRDVQVSVKGADEAAALAADFNKMLHALTDTEQQRKLITDVYAAWTQCAEAMVRIEDEQALLRKICRIVAKRLALKLVWIGMTDADGWVRPVAMSPEPSAYLSRIKVSIKADLEEGQGPIGRAVREVRPVIFHDFSNNQVSKAWHEAAQAEKIKSAGAFPLARNGQVIGTIVIYSGEEKYFHQELISLMHGLANDISFALDNFDLLRRQKIAEEKIRLDACVFDNSQEGVVITNADFTIVSVNRGFNRITGFTEGQVLGCRADILVAQEHLLRYRPAWKMIKAQGLWQGEIKCRRNHGEHYPAWVSITRDVNDQGIVMHYIAVFSDISAKKQTEEALKIAAIAFDTEEGIMVTDADNIILRVNRAFTRLTGYSAEEAIGQKPSLLKSGRQSGAFYQQMWQALLQQGHWQGEIWNRRKNGEVYPEWLTMSVIRNQNNDISNYVGIFSDITQRKEAEERIRQLAFYDPLTALPNRRLLLERLATALAASQRSRHNGAIMFLDLDHFKALNDTQGHDWGDQLLIEVAQRLQHCVRETDTVARLGGDEFVVMLEALESNQAAAAIEAQAVAEKIQAALARPYRLKLVQQGVGRSITYYVSASIGFILFQGHTVGADELLKAADMAMYQAKHAGRDTIRAYDPALQRALQQRVALALDLRLALKNQQLHPYYQIQVDATGQAVGAELLLRWLHPERGFVAPTDFIPLAEEGELIHQIGYWLLLQGCRTLAHWADKPETRALTLSINVSAKQFYRLDIVDQVRAALRKTGVNPARLKLEITESLILHNVQEVMSLMREISALGVSFSMDDFGTGYSSLAYLQQLPLKEIKIDRSFIHDLSANTQNAAIVRTLLSLGQTLDLAVVAEGVETKEQFDYLTEHGCGIFQGYRFGKPVPLAVFEADLAR
ncbi:MAG: hypothetical protein CVV13_06470 [Gammaproteobacteria bacterium HGW-Gammaproteobacteria-3]|nr:MAG: hypothetical protein CVV13_06470 [Gammaproteobacteria bacterium HGW-Gammaproteobacteria-3]